MVIKVYTLCENDTFWGSERKEVQVEVHEWQGPNLNRDRR